MGTSWLVPSAFIGPKLAHPRDGAKEKKVFWLASQRLCVKRQCRRNSALVPTPTRTGAVVTLHRCRRQPIGHAQGMRGACMGCVWAVYASSGVCTGCTGCAREVCKAGTEHARSCAGRAQGIYEACTESAWNVQGACTEHARSGHVHQHVVEVGWGKLWRRRGGGGMKRTLSFLCIH